MTETIIRAGLSDAAQGEQEHTRIAILERRLQIAGGELRIREPLVHKVVVPYRRFHRP